MGLTSEDGRRELGRVEVVRLADKLEAERPDAADKQLQTSALAENEVGRLTKAVAAAAFPLEASAYHKAATMKQQKTTTVWPTQT